MNWTLSLASIVVASIQNSVRIKWGYNVCIYGSVLYKGVSCNDLDIQLIPFSHENDNYKKHGLVAESVANSVKGEVIKSMSLNMIGEMCYIIQFMLDGKIMKIDMVIRRIIPYMPDESEILNEAKKITEKKELLKKILPNYPTL